MANSVGTASATSRQTSEEAAVIRLSQNARKALARDLLDPPPIAPAMERARKRHAKFVRSE